jgi:hypothetical protein
MSPRAPAVSASWPHRQGSQRLASGRLARPPTKAASTRPLSRIAKAADGFAKPDRECFRHSPSIVTSRPPAASPNVRAHALADPRHAALRASPYPARNVAKGRTSTVRSQPLEVRSLPKSRPTHKRSAQFYPPGDFGASRGIRIRTSVHRSKRMRIEGPSCSLTEALER